MGVKVDLINAVYTRLSSYMVPGSALDFVNDIQIGMSETSRTDDTLPIINIELERGEELNVYNKAGKIDRMELKITLWENPLFQENDSNTLYDIENQLGPLYRLETLLNCIEKDKDTDALDLTFGQTQNNQPQIRYEIIHDDTLEINVYVILETKMFNGANR